MPRTRSLAWSELKVGITGVVAIVLLVLIIVAVGGSGGFFWQQYPLRARFTNVQGLKSGAVVRLSGKEIGTVRSVDFVGRDIEVKFEVLKDVRPLLTTEAVATIGSISLLGETIVEIRPGTGGTPLNDNDYVKSVPIPAGFDELASSASASLAQMDGLIADIRGGRGTIGKLVTDDALYNELEAFVAAAGSVTKSLQDGRGTLGGLIKDPAAYKALKASIENLQTMTARINSGQGALGRLISDEATGKALSGAVSNVEQVTGKMSRGEGTVGKLLTDQQLYDRLNSVTARVDQVVAGLEAGRGTAGQLLRDQQLYENMNHAVVELRDLLEAIRKDPKKYLRINVSIF
jgi:phospholipid/cholesterol/gamma-HCH transport system substrate-binding protein